MGSRRDRTGRRADPKDVDASFHSPFRELAETLEERRRAAIKAEKKARRQASAAPPALPRHGAEPSTPPAEPSEEEAFARAMTGASPLATSARASRPPLRPDLQVIGRQEKQLLALALREGFDISFHDHYVRARAAGVSRETLVQLGKGMFAVTAHLDLHGMTLEDARAAVDDFLREQQRRGHRCVLLVTGKGKNSPRQQGVLRENVPEWLARGPSARRVLAFVSARPCDGGVGALYVLMRSGSSRKNRIHVESGGVGGLE